MVKNFLIRIVICLENPSDNALAINVYVRVVMNVWI